MTKEEKQRLKEEKRLKALDEKALKDRKKLNKQREKEKEKEYRKAMKNAGPALTDEILPVVNFINKKSGYFVLEDGTLMDLFFIKSVDLISLNDDLTMQHNFAWDRLYRTYSDDLHIVSFFFPTNTDRQKRYTEYKLRNTRNPRLKELLEESLYQLEYISEHSKDRKFMLFFYAKNEESLMEKRAFLYQKMYLGNQTHLLEKIEPEVKLEIVRKTYSPTLNL